MTSPTPQPDHISHHPSSLAHIEVQLVTPQEYRGSEIIGDLRGIAETLFYPFKFVGYWDGQTGGHLCPKTESGKPCPHGTDTEGQNSYALTIEYELSGELEVVFPHAQLTVYLG